MKIKIYLKAIEWVFKNKNYYLEFTGRNLSGCYSTHIVLKPGTLIGNH